MSDEYNALVHNNTWSLVVLSPEAKVIGYLWVYRTKEKVDGSSNKNKTRFVAQGFLQTPRLDFTKTFSLVIKLTTI